MVDFGNKLPFAEKGRRKKKKDNTMQERFQWLFKIKFLRAFF